MLFISNLSLLLKHVDLVAMATIIAFFLFLTIFYLLFDRNCLLFIVVQDVLPIAITPRAPFLFDSAC